MNNKVEIAKGEIALEAPCNIMAEGQETDMLSSEEFNNSHFKETVREKEDEREGIKEGTRKADKLNSYRNMIKGSSFFGGVQIFNILLTLIRGKFVALILGPEGMGITALFNSSSNTIQKIASLGLNQSIVREVAEAEDESLRKEESIRTSLMMTNLTALFGLILCVAFCVPLSRITFGNSSYWWQFIILGLGVGLAIAGNGKLAILQGLHEVKRISRASIVGGLTGLCIGVPLYYIFGYLGIVPAIVVVFLSVYVFYSINLRRSFVFTQPFLSWKRYLPICKKLLALGVVLMSGDFIATLVGYMINMYVRITGGVDDVGLYQAANSVTNQFAGVIFATLAMDYFPRLSAVVSDNQKMNTTVNRQSEVVAWLMTPAMVLLILTAPLVIRVLLSESFQSVEPLMRWFGIGMLFRAFSFPMAYITFAKGNKKVYFIMEGIICNALTLVISCLFFKWFGLIGLGYALVVDNGLCFIIYYIVNNRLYGYSFSGGSIYNYVFGVILTAGCFVFSMFTSPGLSYTLMSCCGLIALIWAFRCLKSHYKKAD